MFLEFLYYSSNKQVKDIYSHQLQLLQRFFKTVLNDSVYLHFTTIFIHRKIKFFEFHRRTLIEIPEKISK